MAKSLSKSVPHYSARDKLSKAELKKFRGFLRQLNEAGLAPGNWSVEIARPGFIRKTGPRGGKSSLAELVNKHRDFLEGKTRHETAKPKPAKNLLPLHKPTLLTREFPTNKKTLAGLFRDIERNPNILNERKKPDERFAFRIHGTDSLDVFQDIEELLAHFGKYSKLQSEDIYDNLMLIRWDLGKAPWKVRRQFRKPKKTKKPAKKTKAKVKSKKTRSKKTGTKKKQH